MSRPSRAPETGGAGSQGVALGWYASPFQGSGVLDVGILAGATGALPFLQSLGILGDDGTLG
jgi:hypothetical protein